MSPRRQLVAYADPLLHALWAAAVAAPLVPRAGPGPLVTAVAAGTLIDIDHPLAARSLRPVAMLSLATRPRSHSLVVAVGAGALGAAVGGRMHGWAAFGGLASHLLRDAGDDAAPTPLFWPWAPARQVGRRRALVAVTALALGSWALSRAAEGRQRPWDADGAGGGGAGARRRRA